MNTKTYGIKETKELVAFGINLGEALDKSLSDGSFTFEDLTHFFAAFSSAGIALEDIGKVPKEIADLDTAEMVELNQYVADEFDIANDKLEAVIEKSLSAVFIIYELILLFKGGVKKA